MWNVPSPAHTSHAIKCLSVNKTHQTHDVLCDTAAAGTGLASSWSLRHQADDILHLSIYIYLAFAWRNSESVSLAVALSLALSRAKELDQELSRPEAATNLLLLPTISLSQNQPSFVVLGRRIGIVSRLFLVDKLSRPHSIQ
jgi:hypothetical protein